MRTRWKLALLGVLALGVIFYLIVPLATIQVTVDMPPGSTDASPQAVNQAAAWIITGVVLAFAVTALGVIAWVVRHVLRRSQRPEA